MAFTDSIFRWLGNGRATAAGGLATYAPGDASELASDLQGRLMVSVSDAGQLGSAVSAQNVVASDSTTYAITAWKGISVNSTGRVNVRLWDPVAVEAGPQVSIYMAAGIIYPLWIYQVMSTGTDVPLLAAQQIVLYR